MVPFEFLGPYKIGELIGRGGMGNVYSGEHVKSGEKVAVKLIASHVADEPRFRRRFDKEVEALKLLRHPGIVRLIGYGEEDGQLFYSMELIEGETLQALIRRQKKLDYQTAIDLAIQICAALKHAHDIGVTHRDIKPANLLMTPDGTIKLVDFGIPKVFGDSAEQTMPGSILGTPDYMAPEQATGSGVTARTDLYALGSVMYAMLSGRAPFKGKNSTEVIESLKRDRPVPLDLIDTRIPDELVELVHQLLEKEPADRPPTALAVMNRLKAMRIGLQQSQTALVDELPTELGIDSIGTAEASDAQETRQGTAAKAPVPNEDPSLGSTPQKSEPANRAISPDLATVASRAGPTVGRDEVSRHEQSPSLPTHFQTVEESKKNGGYFARGSDSEHHSATHWITIAGMIAILAGGIGLFVWAMRPPTADQLYETAISTNDTGSINAFLTRFPNDDRYDEVFNLQMTNRLKSTLKRLGTQSRIGITPLEPAEEGFLTAMSGREQAPAQTAERLQQWLNAFDSPGSATDASIRELSELARHEMMQLHLRAPAILVDSRANQLIDDIRVAVETLDSQAARKKLTGLIETFQGHDWAIPAVDEARRQLALIEESSQ